MRYCAIILCTLLTGWLAADDSAAQGTATAIVLRDSARQQLEAGQFEAAIAGYKTLIRTWPNDPLVQDALFSIAGIYVVFLDAPAEALRYYRQVTDRYLDSSPLVQRAYANMGKIYMEQGEGDAAHQCFQKIPAGSPAYEESRSLSAWMSTRFRRTLYFNGHETLLSISMLDIAFVVCWIFLGKIGPREDSLRRVLYWSLWSLALLFMLLKSYFNYLLFMMGA